MSRGGGGSPSNSSLYFSFLKAKIANNFEKTNINININTNMVTNRNTNTNMNFNMNVKVSPFANPIGEWFRISH